MPATLGEYSGHGATGGNKRGRCHAAEVLRHGSEHRAGRCRRGKQPPAAQPLPPVSQRPRQIIPATLANLVSTATNAETCE
ncbi:hypothetical protein ACFFX1_14610 [Dactylosporangium sucinum]|uniref:hypothetical protein n=1 Tax=Dactylosporangium sucinum TaxID=1424081 RepID=UPI00167E5766|nr:hypothetical protein [Dactylosporangium sucinum]